MQRLLGNGLLKTPRYSSTIRAAVVVAFLLGSAGAERRAAAGPESRVVPPASQYRFPNGEKLQYTAEWRLWRAGVATLQIERAGGVQQITATANATGIVAVLFPVADRFVSRFSPTTFCSVAYTKHAEEGFQKRETVIRFDRARRVAVVEERDLLDNTVKRREHEIPGCSTDALSGIYYLRTLPLKPESTYRFPLNYGDKTITVSARVEGREVVKTEVGPFDAVRVAISTDDEELRNRGKFWIWYTDDDLHTPVQMRSRLYWGTLTLRLSQWEQ